MVQDSTLSFQGHTLRWRDKNPIIYRAVLVEPADKEAELADAITYSAWESEDGFVYVEYKKIGEVTEWPLHGRRTLESYLLFPRSVADLKLILDRADEVEALRPKARYNTAWTKPTGIDFIGYHTTLSKFERLYIGNGSKVRLAAAKYDKRGGIVPLRRWEWDTDYTQFCDYYRCDPDYIGKWVNATPEERELMRRGKL